MINWQSKNKFIELMDTLANAGINVYEDSDGWHCSDEILAQAIVDSFTLDEAKECICAKISLYAKKLRDTKLQSVSPGEMAAWYMKLSQARAWASSGLATDAPDLVAEAAIRGITLAELCAKVDENAKALSLLEASIAGREGFHRDSVRALSDFESVAQYDYFSGWPSV